MLCIKIEDGRIAQVVDSEQPPQGFVSVPDSFVFVGDDVRYYDADWTPKGESALVDEGVIAPERIVYEMATGHPLTIREFEVPEGYTLQRPEIGQVWNGDGWVTPPPAVPKTIAMRQARRCLRLHGLLDAVQPAIDSLPEPDRTDAQIDWDYSAAVERDRGFVLQVAQALGLSDHQLDELFIEAATL